MPLPRLEIYVPDPARAGFRLGYSPLDAAHLPADDTDLEMILDAGTLDGRRLAPYTPPPVWHDITAAAADIETRHGARPGTLLLEPDVGTLHALLFDAPDLAALGARYGVPIRCRVPSEAADGYSTIWAGRIRDINDEWDTRNRRTTTIDADDAVAALAGIPRYGAAAGTVAARLASLESSLHAYTPDATINVGYGVDEARPLAATVHESTLLKHFQLLATSARARLGVRHSAGMFHPAGDLGFEIVLRAADDHPAPLQEFTDRPDTPAGWPSYLNVRRAGGTSAIVTAVEMTNHLIGPDGNADDQTATINDPTLVATYGPKTERAEVTLPPADVPAVAGWLLDANRHETPTVTELRINGNDGYQYAAWPDRLYPLTVFDRIDVHRLGATYPALIVTIAHQIRATADNPHYHHETRYQLRRITP